MTESLKPRAIVHLDRISANINTVKNVTNDTDIIAVVKANAYGLGATQVASHLEKDIFAFAVVYVEEAIELREAGIVKPILVFTPPSSALMHLYKEFSLIPTVHERDQLSLINTFARQNALKIPVHLKIDTGMGRLGLPCEEASKVILGSLELSNITIDGIYSHLATSDSRDDDYTVEQCHKFRTLKEQLVNRLPKHIKWHLANSGGVLRFRDSHFNAVRPGLCLYGASSSTVREHIDFNQIQPVTDLYGHIVKIKKVKSGESISYGREFIADKDMTVAVVGIGYADGIRTGVKTLLVSINSTYVPVIGRVTMDFIMVDISNLKEVKLFDKAYILNSQQKAEDLANAYGCIPYEILTGIGRRVERIYQS